MKRLPFWSAPLLRRFSILKTLQGKSKASRVADEQAMRSPTVPQNRHKKFERFRHRSYFGCPSLW